MKVIVEDPGCKEDLAQGTRQESVPTSVVLDPWSSLSQWTAARIALGRTGASTPTEAVLAFAADHATARDAIHTGLDTATLSEGLRDRGLSSHTVSSCAPTRADYLARPDLGRVLNEQSRAVLMSTASAAQFRLTLVVADGLSAAAARQHALSLIDHLVPKLISWSLDTIFVATQARVALGDEIGHLRGSEAVLVLLGERPGLRSQNSLGAYLTYNPQPGRSDAERNCVSNIRQGGLSYEQAAARLAGLLTGARALRTTGINLKEDLALTLLPSAPVSVDRPRIESTRPRLAPDE